MEVNRPSGFIQGIIVGFALTMLVEVGSLGAWIASGPVVTIPLATIKSPLRVGLSAATKDVLPYLDHRVRQELPPVIDKSLEPTLQTFQIRFDGLSIALPPKVRRQLMGRLNHMVDRAVARYLAHHLGPSQVFNRRATSLLVDQVLAQLQGQRFPVRIWPGLKVDVTIRVRPH